MMEHINTVRYHLDNPGESVEAYVRRKRIELARQMQPRAKVYLDTKYWLILRDVRLGRSTDANAAKLLQRLEDLVQKGKVLCPLSVDTYAEVYKQTVPETLRATLKVIDDLSLGVTLTEMGDRVRTETLHFVREKTKGRQAVHSLDEIVWTKACYVLGFVTPRFTDLDSRTSTAMQKAFVDQMWIATMEDMLDFMGPDPDGRNGWFPDDIADQLNEGKQSHLHEYSTFKELFLNELGGILSLHKPMFADMMAHVFEVDTGNKAILSDAEREQSGREVAGLIYTAFSLNKIKDELRTFRIMSALHAVMRWDANRKWKANDLHDIHHATGALAYCDWFFTEHALRELVANKNLGTSPFFKCRTVSSIPDALAAVESLST